MLLNSYPRIKNHIIDDMNWVCINFLQPLWIDHYKFIVRIRNYELESIQIHRYELGRLTELGCCMIPGAPCWQLQLLESWCAKKHRFRLKVVRAYCVVVLNGRPAVHRAKPACEEELWPGIPRVLQGDVRRVLQGEGIVWNNHAAILHIQGYLRLSQSNCD